MRSVEETRLSLHRDVESPHADVLQIAFEAGVPAAALFLLAPGRAVAAEADRAETDWILRADLREFLKSAGLIIYLKKR